MLAFELCGGRSLGTGAVGGYPEREGKRERERDRENPPDVDLPGTGGLNFRRISLDTKAA